MTMMTVDRQSDRPVFT